VIIETVKSMTKIETKRILEAIYNIQVTGIHSLNRMGKRRNEGTRMPMQENDVKRFFVRLSTDVELPNVPKAIDCLKKSS
jgi:ribosomal protein L23